jgi:mRNA-degrading endonuclease toxin of MazEF toxin-antitoxin module
LKAEIGSLLFIKDKNDTSKKRPYICIHIFTNKVGVPYDWLIVPITSTDNVGMDNLVQIEHSKLCCKSYAKINNIESISWNEEIEVAKKKFESIYIKDVTDKLKEILTQGITDE